jgi:hypothetical protein
MEHAETMSTSVVAVHPYASVRWGAIMGGWIVATGIASLMYAAGLAFGFSAFEPYNAAANAKVIGIGAAVWIVLTWAVSLFLGGMFASWFDGKADQTVGTLHGVAVWGLAVAASGLFVALGVTQVLQGSAAMLRGGAAMGAAAAGMTARAQAVSPEDDAVTTLQVQLTQRVAQISARTAAAPSAAAPSGPPSTTAQVTLSTTQASAADIRRASEQLDPKTMALVAKALFRADAEGAKSLLAASTSLSQSEIDQTVQSMSAQIERSKTEVQAAADAAARYTAKAMWVIFFSTLIALVAAAAGGWLGAGHIQRVYHLRRYESIDSPAL